MEEKYYVYILVCYSGEDLISGGNLFEDTPAVPEVPVATPLPQQEDVAGHLIIV